MNPAKAITRVSVPDLHCLRAETPAAPRNIALIGICARAERIAAQRGEREQTSGDADAGCPGGRARTA